MVPTKLEIRNEQEPAVWLSPSDYQYIAAPGGIEEKHGRPKAYFRRLAGCLHGTFDRSDWGEYAGFGAKFASRPPTQSIAEYRLAF
jgi:hypothetical protein